MSTYMNIKNKNTKRGESGGGLQPIVYSVFGCKEVGGSKKMGKYNCSLPYLSKHRKRKIRKSLFLFSFLFYTTISSLPECYN